MTAPATVELVIRAVGTPAPQGSKKAFLRGKRVVMIEANPALENWRSDVQTAAVNAMRAHGAWLTLTGPVEVEVLFLMPRPRTVTRALPCVTPDGDKLERAVFDALTKAGVWGDDALVVDGRWRKRYCQHGQEPGARIVVRPAEQVIC